MNFPRGVDAKYIVVKVEGRESAIIFPNYCIHRDISYGFGSPRLVISAGFVRATGDGQLIAYDRSESLDVDSRPEVDTDLINESLGLF